MCCGKHASEVGPISWRGNCIDCAVKLQEENNFSIAANTGYPARRRARGYQRYAESLLLDDVSPRT